MANNHNIEHMEKRRECFTAFGRREGVDEAATNDETTNEEEDKLRDVRLERKLLGTRSFTTRRVLDFLDCVRSFGLSGLIPFGKAARRRENGFKKRMLGEFIILL